jgi:CBS domain-containing protein
MQTVKEIMTTAPITIGPDTEIAEAARILLENRINGVPVVDAGGRLVGILCQSDLIAQQKNLPMPSLFTLLDGFIAMPSMKQVEKQVRKIAAITAGEAMTRDPVTVAPDDDIGKVAALMVDRNFHTLPVVSEGRLVGVVGKEDVLRTLIPNG